MEKTTVFIDTETLTEEELEAELLEARESERNDRENKRI